MISSSTNQKRKSDVALRSNPSTKHKVIASPLVSPRTSTPRLCQQQGTSIIRPSPSEYINSTSRSHSPPDDRTWHSNDVNTSSICAHDRCNVLERSTSRHRGTSAPRPCRQIAPPI
ncbi:hypothetical protein E6C27_scaffold239G001570 [Cucumis melo var. makuwa]|uniref:Uncharacterized protein n=1 Tax=Cucumis melo var. makuwa TaxID=1194695 RepID=A0A5A7SSW5_CUCMM|nr:hypothetical protein E6C27_scaffold239G001570 [Cucumis melo var. makuwa]